MRRQKFNIGGMSCAACAARVEKAAGELNGVSSCEVNLLQNTMQICYDEAQISPALIAAAVKSAGYSAQPADREQSADAHEQAAAELKAQRHALILSFILTMALMTVSMGPMLDFTVISDALIAGSVQLLLALGVMILERGYFKRGFKALFHLAPNMDSLVALGSAASFGYSLYQLTKLHLGMNAAILHNGAPLYFESAASILCLVGIGKYFEHKAKVKSTQAVSALIDLSPKLLRVRRAGQELLLTPDQAVTGDTVILKAGESLGADGTVMSGAGFMDESSLTGESFPKKKTAGSKVLSGAVLTQGYLEIKAEAVGQDTAFAQILQLMDETLSQKVPIARLADIIAYYFVPAVITASIITGAVWLQFAPFAQALNFALCVLVVSCPCALGLAVPTAVTVGVGRAAKLGILFRRLAVLETLSRVDTVIFDKTGTLTAGQMQLLTVKEIKPGAKAFSQLLLFSLESCSAHPLAAALVRDLGGGIKQTLPVSGFKEHPGRGISAVIAGTRYYAGNLRLVQEILGANSSSETISAQALSAAAGFAAEHEAQGRAALHLFNDKELLCSYALGDALKPDAKELIRRLQARGLRCLMFTGDSRPAAQHAAQALGLDGFKAELLPADKLALIKELQRQGHKVVMLGDGVNDALCLTQADVGIGVQGASDIAVSACDAVFMNPKLLTLDTALTLSALIYRNIKENLFWAFIYNVLTIPLAAGVFYVSLGWQLTPMIAAGLMSISSLCVVSNALRLNFIKLDTADEAAAGAAGESAFKEKTMRKVIHIDGMHCSHCTASVLNALSALPGAQNVRVSLEDKCAAGDFGPEVTADLIAGVISALGFTVTSVEDA